MANRVIAVVAHIDHGKTTLLDNFLAYKGHIPSSLSGEMRFLDSRKDEQVRGITLKNSFIEINGDNFIDTPGHVDFQGLIHSAAMMADYFLLVIDIVEGITPRTLSLVKYINVKRTILILNKADKVVDADAVEMVVYKLNNIIGEFLFDWSKNNVILCSAVKCGAINYNLFSQAKKNTLKTAYKAFQALLDKINTKETSSIVEKYKIKVVTDKNIFLSVFPVMKCIYNSIDTLTKATIQSSNTAEVAITTCCILNNKNIYNRDNILYVTRIYDSPINVNDEYYSCINDHCEIAKIEKIFLFNGKYLIESNIGYPNTLVCIKGNFRKNSILSKEIIRNDYQEPPSPLYLAKLGFSNISTEIEKIKEFFITEKLIEDSIRVRKNKKNEFEIKCNGRVQFEKILEDLNLANIEYKNAGCHYKFKEFVSCHAKNEYINDDLHMLIEIMPADKLEYDIETKNGIVKSILKAFTKSGPLIREEIVNTKFIIKIIKGRSMSIINNLYQYLSEVYFTAKPKIIPLYYNMRICIMIEYLGVVYNTLSKYEYHLIEEVFDNKNEYYIITFKAPQCYFRDIIKEVTALSKGTAYVEANEDDYYNYGVDLSKFIEDLMIEKGLFKQKQIISDPEKQRTLNK